MESWFTPWRYSYLVSPRQGGGCLFCEIRDAADDRENLVLHRGEECYIVLNRYPYNNGHLMIVPNRHGDFLGDLTESARAELQVLTTLCEEVLREAYRPEGLNVGINMGKSAGAGIAGHLHVHILPRWSGDTNFITIVGEARIIPEELSDTWARLRPLIERRR